MAKRLPFVSIIIPTYKDWDYLKLCLEALAGQTYSSERYEIIVVNNDPESSLPYPLPGNNVSLLAEENPGSYAARNKGIERAHGELLGFIDADCIPDPDWIENAVNIFQEKKSVYRLAGRIELTFEERISPAALYEKVFAFNQESLAARGTSVTANMWSRAEVFDRVGMFNARLQSGDDTRWGLRAAAAGFSIMYAPEVRVNHPARDSEEGLIKKARRVYGGWYLINGWDSKSKLVKFALSVYPLRPPVNTLRRLFSAESMSIKEKLLVFRLVLKLRFNQWQEHMKMALGGEPERS